MACRRIDLRERQWTPGAHPLERKKGPEGKMVLLELGPGFEDPNVCQRSHVIYVLEGSLELVLDHGVERAEAGEVLLVDAGTTHRAANRGSVPVVAFVVSDV
jgi:mannose-6-phosphate isomerase-like protein (cupin superfamily)